LRVSEALLLPKRCLTVEREGTIQCAKETGEMWGMSQSRSRPEITERDCKQFVS